MKKIVAMLLLLGMIGATSTLASEDATEGVTEELSKWSKAGEEIGEAAHAVGDATADSSKKAWKATKEGSVEAWDATKEGSAEAWDKTKSKSKEMWEKGKANVHDATAPDAQPLESD